MGSSVKLPDWEQEVVEFQYNDCLGSSFAYFYIDIVIYGFNTTIVWVRQGSILKELKQSIKFQYNDCLGSSLSESESFVIL